MPLIVTSSNAAYFPFAQDLVTSLRNKRFAHAFDIALLDTGLEESQKLWMESACVRIVPVESRNLLPQMEKLEAANPAFRTLVAQMFLPETFPEADVIIWIDADIWVQTAEAIDTVIPLAAASDAIALSPEFDRCYTPFFESADTWEIYRSWYAANFDEATTRAMLFKPMFNVGFWALRAQSPLWAAWRLRYLALVETLQDASPANFMAHQLSLNVLLSMHKMPHAILPASFNWLTAFALPMYRKKTGLYVEPQPPYRPISQIHLTRPIKAQTESIACVEGGTLATSLMLRGKPKG